MFLFVVAVVAVVALVVVPCWRTINREKHKTALLGA
jgi:Tfp pilus assembly protein PilE